MTTPIHDGLAQEHDNANIPLAETPIYAQMKAEEFDRTLASVKSTFEQTAEAMRILGEGARAAFASPADLEDFTARAIAEHRTVLTANQVASIRPIDRFTLTRKPALQKGRKP